MKKFRVEVEHSIPKDIYDVYAENQYEAYKKVRDNRSECKKVGCGMQAERILDPWEVIE